MSRTSLLVRKSLTVASIPLMILTTSCASHKGEICDSVMFVPMNCVAPAAKSERLASIAHNPVAATPSSTRTAEPAPAGTPSAPQPAAVPEVPPVNAIYFGLGQSDLTDGSKVTLASIAEYLKAASSESVKLASYTDPIGSVKVNKALAERRAKTVSDAFVALGVDQNRITNIAVDPNDEKALPANEYWRLRKVAILYGPETMARIDVQEAAEEEHADKDIQPNRIVKAPKPKTAKDPKDAHKSESVDDVGGVADKSKLETIDVIYWRSINHALFILAKQLGYFEQEGFNVKLHESKLEANELAIKLADSVGVIKSVRPNSAMDVKSKRYFLGAVCPYGYHEAIAKKLPFVSIGGMLTITSTMLMKKDMYDAIRHDIKSFRGAIGRVNLLANEFDHAYLFTDRLRQAGLKEGVDFKLVVYKDYGALYDALFRGEIVTAKADPPDDLELIKRHPEFVLYPLAALNLNLPCCRQVVTRDNLKKNRPKYVRFERAVLRAQRYIVEHPIESMDILSKFLNISLPTVRSLMQRTGFALTANPNMKGAQAMANSMKVRLGAAMTGDLEEASDTSVYEDALASLIKEDPANPALQAMLGVYNRTR